MRNEKRLKWNVEVYPQLPHFIVASNMKFLKVHTILSVGATKRIVKKLMEVV